MEGRGKHMLQASRRTTQREGVKQHNPWLTTHGVHPACDRRPDDTYASGTTTCTANCLESTPSA
jgi:hypothetical protein